MKFSSSEFRVWIGKGLSLFVSFFLSLKGDLVSLGNSTFFFDFSYGRKIGLKRQARDEFQIQNQSIPSRYPRAPQQDQVKSSQQEEERNAPQFTTSMSHKRIFELPV